MFSTTVGQVARKKTNIPVTSYMVIHKWLLKTAILPASLVEIENNSVSGKQIWRCHVVTILLVVQLARYTCCILKPSEDFHESVGYIMSVLGPGASVMATLLNIANFACIIDRTWIYKKIIVERVQVFKDMIPLTQLTCGATIAGHLRLTRANYEKFNFQAWICGHVNSVVTFGNVLANVVIFGICLVVLTKKESNYFMMLYYLFWFIYHELVIFYLFGTHNTLICAFYLKMYYLKLRFRQVNEAVASIADRPLTKMDVRELDAAILEHHQVTCKAIEYNKAMCGFLAVLVFLATPVAGLAFFIFVYVKFKAPFIAEACAMIFICIVTMVLFSAANSAAVYLESRRSYSRLNSILVDKDNVLTLEVKIRVDRKRKLVSHVVTVAVIIQLTRYTLCTLVNEGPFHQNVGYLLQVLGPGASFMALFFNICLTACFTLRIWMYKKVVIDKVQLFKEMIPMTEMSSAARISEYVKLTAENYAKFNVQSWLCGHIIAIVTYGSTVANIFIHGTCLTILIRQQSSYFMILYYSFWFAYHEILMYLVFGTHITLICGFYLKVYYLKLRFRQVNEVVTRLARTYLSKMDIRALEAAILDHHEVACKTMEYNRVISGFLLAIVFLATPVVGVSCFIIFYIKFEAPFITEACFMAIVNIVFMVSFSASKSAAVYLEVLGPGASFMALFFNICLFACFSGRIWMYKRVVIDKVQLFKEMIPITQLTSAAHIAEIVKLSKENYAKFNYQSWFCGHVITIMMRSSVVANMFIHGICLIILIRRQSNYFLMMYYSSWFLYHEIVMYFVIGTHITVICTFYLKVHYLKLRFRQVNEAVALLARKSLTKIDLRILEAAILDHHDVACKTMEYNRVIRFYLVNIVFLATPVAGVSCFIIFYIKFEAPFITEACVIAVVNIVFMVFFGAVKSAEVYLEVRDRYSALHKGVQFGLTFHIEFNGKYRQNSQTFM
ncbi:hypothetical protein HDE_13117 [Halotydeus destructor]|nr:hypothetical protein HDE_13117 [Halotydeus destructor]